MMHILYKAEINAIPVLARRAGSLRGMAGRSSISRRAAGRHRCPHAGADDRGHVGWFVPGVDTASGGLRCYTFP